MSLSNSSDCTKPEGLRIPRRGALRPIRSRNKPLAKTNDGQSTHIFAKVRRSGVQVNALLLSVGGLAIAIPTYAATAETEFTVMMALLIFGTMATRMLIFVTQLFFRRVHQRSGEKLLRNLPFCPMGSLVGALLVAALSITILFTKELTMPLIFGVPFARSSGHCAS